MWKRIALAVVVLAIAAAGAVLAFAPAMVESGRNQVIAHDPWPVSEAARALHQRLTVADLHADPLLWNRDLTERGDRGHVDLPRLVAGNVAVQVFTAVTKSPAGQNYEENSSEAMDNITLLALAQAWPPATWTSLAERALHQAGRLHDFERRAPKMLRIVRTRQDLQDVLDARAAGERLVAGVLGLEGMHALDGDLANLDRLWGLTHFFDNALAGSLHGEGGSGLTEFGRRVVREALARDAIIDLAHASPKAAWEVLEMVDRPVVVSHGGTHNHCPVVRNFPDDLMQAVAAQGGVVGIGYWEDAVCGATPAEIVAAIAAAVDLLGEDHVALGSDFDGSVTTPFDTSELAALTHEMLALGWSEPRIAKVMGGNAVRVMLELLPE